MPMLNAFKTASYVSAAGGEPKPNCGIVLPEESLTVLPMLSVMMNYEADGEARKKMKGGGCHLLGGY